MTATKFTSLAEANILNMDHPIFVSLISYTVLREQRDPVALAMVAVVIVGIWPTLAPGRIDLKTTNQWGLESDLIGR